MMVLKKEIKPHLVFDCLSMFTFGQGFAQLVNKSCLYFYHTYFKKSIDIRDFVFCVMILLQ